MNHILSGAWLYKRKKEPEALKEEEVIDIVQQAMDNPSANTTVKSPNPDCKRVAKRTNTSGLQTASKETNFQHDEQNTHTMVDPKVVDFFKDFPEPYREKAIQRFSDRSGWYYWDAIRNFSMHHERSTAMNRGVFLEDVREKERFEEELLKKRQEERLEELEQERRERVVPEWEKALKQYIPLESDDTMGSKLFRVANLTLLSLVLCRMGFRARPPQVDRWRGYTLRALEFGAAGLTGTGAVCELMDWGPFDRSIDKRDILTKMYDDFIDDVNTLTDYVKGKSK